MNTITLDEIAHNLSAQEEVLQQTRNLHYLFQGLLIGVGFVSCTTCMTLLFTVNKLSVSVQLVVFTLNSFAAFCCFTGYRLCTSYSERIDVRGRMVDLLQHVQLIYSQSKIFILENLLKDLASEGKIGYLVKVAEGISPQPITEDHPPYKYKRKKLPATNDLIEYIYYIQYEADIIDIKYIKETHDTDKLTITISNNRRETSETRNGHRNLFYILWSFLSPTVLVVFLFDIIFFCPYSIAVGPYCWEVQNPGRKPFCEVNRLNPGLAIVPGASANYANAIQPTTTVAPSPVPH